MISAIIGLGNIGKKYTGTRHNLGFEVINLIARKWEIEPQAGDGDYYYAPKEYDNRIIRLFWPTTYMNNSGVAVKQILDGFGLSPENLLVVYDDINLPLGKLRIRMTGSDGGHNGMSSVIYNLETEGILRLRLGIGTLPEGVDQVDYVLGKFSPDEAEILNKMLEKGAEAVLYLLRNRPEEAMNLYNRNPAPNCD